VAAFAAAAGIELSYVPFKGAAPALVATVGRHVDVVSPGVSEAITLNEAKKLRAIVSLSTKRLRHYPDTPTAKELGFDVVVSRWMGLAAPKGLPKDVKALLVDAFKKATETEEFKKFNAQNGLEPFHGTPDEARVWIKNQADYFKKVADKAGIQPE
jgi:tripartite-type tricarboxylate transporter receptor subunit TctC